MPPPKFMPCWLVHLLQDRSCVSELVKMKRTQSGLLLSRMQVPACYKEEKDITPPVMRHFKKEESHLNLVMIRYPLIGALRGLGARTKNKKVTVPYVQLLITKRVRYKKGCICGMTLKSSKIRKMYLQSTEYVQEHFKSILTVQDQLLHRKLKMFFKV